MTESIDHYQLGLRAFCDQTNGQAPDYISSAKHLSMAYEEGNLNAGWLLTHCYATGLGVPRDFQRTEELTTELISRGCEEAHIFLTHIYIKGNNTPKTQEYTERILALIQSGEGRSLDDILWPEFCFLVQASAIEDIDDDYEDIARRYYEKSIFHMRHGAWAMNLASKESENNHLELERLLDIGCAASDETCHHIRGEILLQKNDSEQQAIKHLERSFARDIILANLCSTANEKEQMLRRYWERKRWGFSELRRPQELDIDIDLIPNSWSGIEMAFDVPFVNKLIKQGIIWHSFTPSQPLIRLSRLKTGQALTLRMRSTLSGLDESITYIPAAEQVVLDLRRDYGWNWGDLDLEISNGEQNTRIIVSEDEQEQINPIKVLKPLLCWRRSFMLGYVLQIIAPDHEFKNVVIHLSTQEKSKPINIKLRKSKEFGWRQMPSRRGPQMGKPFVVTVEGYAPLIVVLSPPPRNDQDLDTSKLQHLDYSEALQIINSLPSLSSTDTLSI